MTWLESLVEARRATRTEWLSLRHFQRRLARAKAMEPRWLGAVTEFGVRIELQQATVALAFLRAFRPAHRSV